MPTLIQTQTEGNKEVKVKGGSEDNKVPKQQTSDNEEGKEKGDGVDEVKVPKHQTEKCNEERIDKKAATFGGLKKGFLLKKRNRPESTAKNSLPLCVCFFFFTHIQYSCYS